MMTIGLAKEADFPGVLRVLHANLLSKKADPEDPALSQSGFLIHTFNETDFKSYCDDPQALITVVKNANEIVGYQVAYVMKGDERQEFLEKVTLIDDNDTAWQTQFLYHRHIAKFSGHKGVGQLLMNELVNFAKQKQFTHIICMIALDPIRNLASEKFHEQFNFKKIGKKLDAIENKIYSVFSKEI